MVLVGCSSTSSVPEDDKLFTGLRKTEYENYVACDHFYSTQEEVEAALATTPNGALFDSPYHRMPPYRCGYTMRFSIRVAVWASGYVQRSVSHQCCLVLSILRYTHKW